MPVQRRNGELTQKKGKGTPQGGVVSPLLANLFLHYAFDKWIENLNSNVKLERYADDAIIHFKTQRQADWLLNKLHERMADCHFEMRIVQSNAFLPLGNPMDHEHLDL